MDSIIARYITAVLLLSLLVGAGKLAYQGLVGQRSAQYVADELQVVRTLRITYTGMASTLGLGAQPVANFPALAFLWASPSPGGATLGALGSLVDTWGNQMQVLGFGDALPAGLALAQNQLAIIDGDASLAAAACQVIVSTEAGLAFAAYAWAPASGAYALIGTQGSALSTTQVAAACASSNVSLVFVFNAG